MDKAMQSRMDSIVEDEVRKGFRIKTLPDELVAELEEAHAADPTIPVFRKVRFTKLTPRKRRQVNEAVVRRYHLDLKNSDILSNEQLRRLNIERGEWSLEQEKRLEKLQEETNAMMRDLYLEGFDKRSEWIDQMVKATEIVRAEIADAHDGENRQSLTDEQKAEALERFDRWLDWSVDRQAIFDAKYAAAQGLEKYSPDRDQQWLLDHAPSLAFVDAVHEIDDIRDKLVRLTKLADLRKELLELQSRQSKMLAESVEQRRDAAEEMARVYYCTEIANEADVGQGLITKTVDGIWDLPETVIQWLQIEVYFFLNGVPDESREFLSQWGFIAAPRSSGSPQPSGESPVEPTSNSDGPPSTPTPAGSSESTAATSSVT